MEVVAGPMATEFVPVAVESASVELAWKYLIPAPFTSALRVVRLLLTLDRPVESETTPLCAVLMPLDAEVDRAMTLLFVVDRPVDKEPTLLCAVLIPDEADVESEPT